MRYHLVFYILLLPLWLNAQAKSTVEFSVPGGFYETNQRVSLSAAAGSIIYYTLDGTSPNSSSYRYKGDPILTDSIAIIRAVAYLDGKRSTTVTQSYFQNRKHSLPVVSIVTDPAHLWDFSTGIYAKGCCADSIPPYYGANFWKGWERPCNIELYDVK